VLERRPGGERGVRRVRYLQGDEFWRAGEKGLWSEPLLAAALSRSNTPQGDPMRDGRTQDLVGLGLVPKLAKAPRGWLLEHHDGLRTALLVLDGVVTDFNFAVRAAGGRIHSAQLFRAPSPGDHQYSRLAAVLDDFFVSGKEPWSVKRNLLVAALLELFAKPSAREGKWVRLS
jgi:hypothetical protein